MDTAHDARLREILDLFNEANTDLVTRLEAVSDEAAGRVPADGGWSAAQVGVHVAGVTRSLAKVVSGEVAAAAPAPEGFVERPWAEVAALIPDKASAPERLRPGAGVTRGEAIEALRASAGTFDAALRALDPARAAGYTFTYPLVGALSLYQVAEWAARHVRRHLAQATRVLSEGLDPLCGARRSTPLASRRRRVVVGVRFEPARGSRRDFGHPPPRP